MKIDLILDANGAYASAIFRNVGPKPVGIFLLVGISDIRTVTDFYGTASSSKEYYFRLALHYLSNSAGTI